MTAMNRRSLLRGVALAAFGCTLIPTIAQSAPRMASEDAGPPESPVEKARVRRRNRRAVCWRHGHRTKCSAR